MLWDVIAPWQHQANAVASFGGTATLNLRPASWRDQTPGTGGDWGGLIYVSGRWPIHPLPPFLPPGAASLSNLSFLSTILVCDVGSFRSPHTHSPWCITLVISSPSCLCYGLIYHNSSFYHTLSTRYSHGHYHIVEWPQAVQHRGLM